MTHWFCCLHDILHTMFYNTVGIMGTRPTLPHAVNSACFLFPGCEINFWRLKTRRKSATRSGSRAESGAIHEFCRSILYQRTTISSRDNMISNNEKSPQEKNPTNCQNMMAARLTALALLLHVPGAPATAKMNVLHMVAVRARCLPVRSPRCPRPGGLSVLPNEIRADP